MLRSRQSRCTKPKDLAKQQRGNLARYLGGNMRWWLGAIVGAQLLFLTPAYAAPWIQFTDPSGQFSVTFPTAPEIKPTVQTPRFTPGAKTFPLSAYGTREDGNKVFLWVFDIDLTGADADAQKIVDAQQSHLLQSGTNGTAKAVKLDGVACRRLDVTGPDVGEESITTIFFLKGHLYQVVANTFAGATAQGKENAQRFSDSLHFNH